MGSKSKRALLLFMVMCLALPQMLAAPMAASGFAVGEEFLISDAPGPQNQADVSNGYVVWRDGRDGTCYDDEGEEFDNGGEWNIYGFDVSKRIEDVVCGAVNVQSQPAISGDVVVWVDKRSVGDREDDEVDDYGVFNDIYMRDLSTGKEKVVCAVEGEQCKPETDGKTIVWVDQRNYDDTYEDIYMYDIATGKESIVTTATNAQRHPLVGGKKVVYKDWSDGGGARIKVRDLTSKDTTTVPAGGSNINIQEMAFDGQSIVWVERDYNVWTYSLYRYDVGTKSRSTITSAPAGYLIEQPDVDGEWVVWSDARNGDNDVFAYNIVSGVETTVCADVDCQGNPAVDDGLVIWNDNRVEDDDYPDLYGKYLDAAEGLETAPVSGATRYGTAVLTSRAAYPLGSENVVIAVGTNWPDALSGGVLAAVLDAPVLLTAGDGLPAETAAELDRLGAKNAYVIGGSGVVSSVAFEQIANHVNGKTTRIGGANRFQTSEMVAARVKALQGVEYGGKAFFATGANFPDALAGAPVAGALGAPILLADGSTLRDSTVACMKAIGVKKGVVLGGTSAVPSSVKTRIESVTATSAVRLDGGNRYATSVSIANYGVANGMEWFSPALATGANFPDALAAGPMQARFGSPLLLTNGSSLSAEPAAVLKANKADIERVSFVGGTAVISNTVRNQVKSLIK